MGARRETSEETAARFLELSRGRWRRKRRERRQLRAERTPRRIKCDFAEPTLRAIYEALCERLGTGDLGGDALAIAVIATDMVATYLGESTGDEPPLDDRNLK